MTIIFVPPASIEAQKAKAQARRVNPYRPQNNEKLSCIVFPFKLDRNSEIYIEKELTPKEALIDKSSSLNKADGLKGLIISGFSKEPFPSTSVKKGSSTHKANFADINKFVYAKLERSFKSIEDISYKLISEK